MSRAKLLKY